MLAYAVFINEQTLAAAPRSGTQREIYRKNLRGLDQFANRDVTPSNA